MQSFRGFTALLLLLVLLTGSSSSGAALSRIRVTADGVNLRAAARTSSETVAQVSKGSSLSVISEEEEWIRIVPPKAVELWVFGGLVRDGVVAGSHVKIRCGPGINYTSVGEVNRGDHVHERGSFNNWLKIAPPPGCSLWISRQYVVNSGGTTSGSSSAERAVSPVEEARSASLKKPAFREVATIPARGIVSVEPPDKLDKTAPSAVSNGSRAESSRASAATPGPGLVARTGVVKRSGIMTRRHARYRLVRRDVTGRFVTICGLDGEAGELGKFLDRNVLVTGKELTPQGSRWPILSVDGIKAQ